jgi:hypothetical protein
MLPAGGEEAIQPPLIPGKDRNDYNDKENESFVHCASRGVWLLTMLTCREALYDLRIIVKGFGNGLPKKDDAFIPCAQHR